MPPILLYPSLKKNEYFSPCQQNQSLPKRHLVTPVLATPKPPQSVKGIHWTTFSINKRIPFLPSYSIWWQRYPASGTLCGVAPWDGTSGGSLCDVAPLGGTLCGSSLVARASQGQQSACPTSFPLPWYTVTHSLRGLKPPSLILYGISYSHMSVYKP